MRRSRLATFLTLLVIALLPLRSANAHLHLCLDGQGPLVAYHAEDIPTHDGIDRAGDGHTDADVDVSGAASVGKLADVDKDLIPFLPPQVPALLLPLPERWRGPSARAPVPINASPEFPPPGRGPPIQAS